MGRKIYHPKTNQKKAGVALLILDRIDYKLKKIIRDR